MKIKEWLKKQIIPKNLHGWILGIVLATITFSMIIMVVNQYAVEKEVSTDCNKDFEYLEGVLE